MNESDISSLFSAIDDIKERLECIEEKEPVISEDLSQKIDECTDTLLEHMEGLISFSDNLVGTMEAADLQLGIAEEKLNETMQKSEDNEKRFNNMILQLKGCISMTQSLFKQYKKPTPVWYEMSKTPPPSGIIKVKNKNGCEGIARCERSSTEYILMSVEGKLDDQPEFWKHV